MATCIEDLWHEQIEWVMRRARESRIRLMTRRLTTQPMNRPVTGPRGGFRSGTSFILPGGNQGRNDSRFAVRVASEVSRRSGEIVAFGLGTKCPLDTHITLNLEKDHE